MRPEAVKARAEFASSLIDLEALLRNMLKAFRETYLCHLLGLMTVG